MLRARFRANFKDPRPVNWPVRYPFWVTGYAADDSCAIVVSYADDKKYIFDNWPEAEGIEWEETDSITFTDRFQRPDWFTEDD